MKCVGVGERKPVDFRQVFFRTFFEISGISNDKNGEIEYSIERKIDNHFGGKQYGRIFGIECNRRAVGYR